ncbi:MAG: hypothetical protein ACRCX2_10090 [Paraclostridium sp.]
MRKKTNYVARFECEECMEMIEGQMDEVYFEMFDQYFNTINIECPKCRGDNDLNYEDVFKRNGEFIKGDDLVKCDNCSKHLAYKYRVCSGKWIDKEYMLDKEVFCSDKCKEEYYN